MSVNAWWENDPEQRYWMQITDREDLNGPLLSPKLPGFTWGYDLVSQVQPGDRVLHWSTRGPRPVLAGWSEVTDHAHVIPEYTWTPRHGWERTTPGWRAALGSFHPFKRPVPNSDLRPLLEAIIAVDVDLSSKHRGTIYFPFTRYGSNRPEAYQELRATQAYFVKFPVELFGVIPGIDAARIDGPADPAETDLPEDFHVAGAKAPKGRTTRAQDPALRAAVERRSLDVAQEYYEVELRGSDYEEIGKPYDIRVRVEGVTRRCEVKGSTMDIDTVELTTNEVDHGVTFSPLDLIVVDRIVPIRDPGTGEVIGAAGGRRRVWVDWTPAPEDLKPTKYAYSLPPLP